MTLLSRPDQKANSSDPLTAGARMKREAFHRAYEAAPAGFKAELIGGVVHVPSPLAHLHGSYHFWMNGLFFNYVGSTPGVDGGDNASVLLGEESEPQPDLFLRILPECGGLSRVNADGYLEGPPELIVEIAASSLATDLNHKKIDYEKYNVSEYMVVAVDDKRVHWFDLGDGSELSGDQNGVIQSISFPGLWLDVKALFDHDRGRLLATLEQGLACAEHACFVAELARRRATKGR